MSWVGGAFQLYAAIVLLPPLFFLIHTNMRGGVHMRTCTSFFFFLNVANKRFSVCAIGKKASRLLKAQCVRLVST